MAYLDYDGLSNVKERLDEIYLREGNLSYRLDPLDGNIQINRLTTADETAASALSGFNIDVNVHTPDEMGVFHPGTGFVETAYAMANRLYLVWMSNGVLEIGLVRISVDVQTKAITYSALGHTSMAYGVAEVDTEWTIEALPDELPPATASTLGGVKVGNGLSVASDGTLSSDLDYAASPISGGNAVRANGILYAAVDSTSTSTNFTATVDGLTELYDGACVMLHNGVVTSAKGFTVNVNGLGAKKCYSNMTNATQETTIFNVAYTLMFVYSTALDSGNGGWWVYRGYDSNTTYTPMKLGFGYGHCTTAAATAAKAVAISGYTLNTGGIVTVLFDNDVQAGATLNVTSKGAKAIYHKGAAITDGIIKAGDTATFIYSGQYHLISIDRNDIADGSVTTEKLADDAVTFNKIDGSAVREMRNISLIAADSQTDQALTALSFLHSTLTPAQMAVDNRYADSSYRLCWISGTSLEVAPITFVGNLQTLAIALYARGRTSTADGILGVDESWTITALPTDGDGVSY